MTSDLRTGPSTERAPTRTNARCSTQCFPCFLLASLPRPTLLLRIECCKDLKEGGFGDRLPDPYIVAQFIQTKSDGSDGSVLHEWTTGHHNDTRDPVWGECFKLNKLPLDGTRLRLTVWDHDFGGIGNDFMGQV